MTESTEFESLSPTTIADVLSADCFMDFAMRPLWSGMPRLVGPAYPVKCPPGDNLMLHAAIYLAAPGSVICVETGDMKFAVAGGNVCAVAQHRGIAGFVVDGVIRDLSEIRALRFPVVARGVVPFPGAEEELGTLESPITCGGVSVSLGDAVVADDDGVAVVPRARLEETLERARALASVDATTSLEDWQVKHRARINAILESKGFS
jgi:4-hydroxy-4-methyl-2-oxoglutarate aldolase